MTRTRIRVFAEESGPLFDGRADADLYKWMDETKKAVAVAGLGQVQARLDKVLKHPTGAYQSNLQTVTVGRNDQVVTDRGVAYGPWLEGVSKRNESTRFKGYHTFRYVFRRLRKEATPIAQKILDKYIERMN